MRFPIDVRDLTFIAGSDPAGVTGMEGRDSLTGRRSSWAHACRDDEVVCGRVALTVDADTRLGLTARERRCVTVRFLDRLEPVLHAELTELVRRRGAVARRVAERMDPIEIVFDDPRLGLQRIIGWIQPPQRRVGDLHDIQLRSTRTSAMTEEPTPRLSGEEIVALKFAAHRQLARWSNKPHSSPSAAPAGQGGACTTATTPRCTTPAPTSKASPTSRPRASLHHTATERPTQGDQQP